MDLTSPRTYVFGPFALIPTRQLLLERGIPVRIGGRPLDILTVLVDRPGHVVSKREIFARVWPNTVVEDANLKVNMMTLRRLLGEQAGGPTYIATVAGRGYRFIADVQVVDSVDPLLASDRAAVSGSKLPTSSARIIGRQSCIEGIRLALNDSRLVSIVGAGGFGKTTVAVEVARLVEHEGPSTVTYVDLARVASAEFVPATLLSALGITPGNTDALQALVSILAKRKVLLLLDTCEHVLGAVALVCNVLLDKTADVRILATSRQVLRAQGEVIKWLEPLEVPPQDAAASVASLLSYPAAELLVERASEKSGYRLQESDARFIAKICRRLDGQPLALELISARLMGRSPKAVLGELDDRFGSLRHDSPDGPRRQQTLLATLEWSYALLTRVEAATLRAVSIFAGSFDIHAAAAVATRHGLGLVEAFDAISGLRAKSMLSLDEKHGELQYRLLDTTRAFALELLEREGELDAVCASHARLQLEILTRSGMEYDTAPAQRWQARFGDLADDLRKALDWALYRRQDAMLGIRLVAAALPLWRELSLLEECHRNCQFALEAYTREGCTDTPLKLKVTVELAIATTYLDRDAAEVAAHFTNALGLARETGDGRAECRVLSALATYNLLAENLEVLPAVLEALRSAAVQLGERAAIWEYEQLSAILEHLLGDLRACHARLVRLHSQTFDHHEGSIPRFQIHQNLNIATQLAANCWLVGKPGEAVRRMHQIAQQAVETRHGLTLIHCLARGVIWTMEMCRDHEMSRHYTDLLRATIYRYGMSSWIPLADCLSETVDAFSGVSKSAEPLRGAFERMRRATGPVRSQSYLATVAHAMLSVGQPDDAAKTLDSVFDRGAHRWILPELLRLRATIESSFDHQDQTESLLRQSICVADEVGLPSWKLRSAFDLALLLKRRGQVGEARQVLASAYAVFNEEFETGDLCRARDLLAEL